MDERSYHYSLYFMNFLGFLIQHCFLHLPSPRKCKSKWPPGWWMIGFFFYFDVVILGQVPRHISDLTSLPYSTCIGLFHMYLISCLAAYDWRVLACRPKCRWSSASLSLLFTHYQSFPANANCVTVQHPLLFPSIISLKVSCQHSESCQFSASSDMGNVL